MKLDLGFQLILMIIGSFVRMVINKQIEFSFPPYRFYDKQNSPNSSPPEPHWESSRRSHGSPGWMGKGMPPSSPLPSMTTASRSWRIVLSPLPRYTLSLNHCWEAITSHEFTLLIISPLNGSRTF